MEATMISNKNFFKPIVNYVHYFCFYSVEKFSKEENLKFYEAVVYFLWKFLASNLKNYFDTIYEGNEEYDGDAESKNYHSIFFQVADLIIGIVSKTPS